MGEEAGSEEWVEEDQADVAVALLLLATHLVLPLLLIIILLILMHTCLDLVLGQILVLNKVLLSSLDLRMEVVDPCGEDLFINNFLDLVNLKIKRNREMMLRLQCLLICLPKKLGRTVLLMQLRTWYLR